MKKIALAIEKFSRYAGGAESYAVSLATSLIENGWEVHLFGETWDGEPEAAVFHKINIPKYIPAWLKMVLFALNHKRAVKNQGFDVIMGFGNTIYMNVYQSHGGVHRFSTRRKIYSERNAFLRMIKRLLIFFSIKDKVRNWIESAPFRLEPRPKIIAISQMVREDMSTYFTINEEDIILIYNGIDTKKFNPGLRDQLRGIDRLRLGLKDDDIAFLFLSYTLKKKGVEPLIEAAAQLKKHNIINFKIIVVGGRPYPFLMRQIACAGLDNAVMFTGPTKAPEEYYAACDVLVIPTYYDACSLVVIEAMACGLPAITTVCNGAAGIITNGQDGYVVSHPPASEELAKVMKAFTSKEKLKNMSVEALRTGKQYSIEENHREMIAVFDELVRKNSPT